MSSNDERLFTPRFFLMCAFTLTVFLSAFQLLPTAPFRILSLGGSEFAAGLFLGFLTYASAFSAPFTGALADRILRRRLLVTASVAIATFSASYAFISSVPLMLALLAVSGSRPWMLASAIVFGVGFGSAYPIYTAYVLQHVDTRRRGAAFGGILAAFDTAIGTGSIPYFLFSGRRLLWTTSISEHPV